MDRNFHLKVNGKYKNYTGAGRGEGGGGGGGYISDIAVVLSKLNQVYTVLVLIIKCYLYILKADSTISGTQLEPSKIIFEP